MLQFSIIPVLLLHSLESEYLSGAAGLIKKAHFQSFRFSEIARLSSELFYDGQLLCATDSVANASMVHLDESVESSEWIKSALRSDLQASVLFLDTRSNDSDRTDFRAANDGPGLTYNRGEAATIVQLCDALIKVRYFRSVWSKRTVLV